MFNKHIMSSYESSIIKKNTNQSKLKKFKIKNKETEMTINEVSIINPSIELNKTFTHIIDNYNFDYLTPKVCIEIFKDGRPFSYFIEKWIESNYPLKHISGCKQYDFVDINDESIKYDEKTFTNNGCNFCPSNMLGQGRKFDKEVFEEKTKKMIFCIVSNVNFPEIKIKFIKGIELLNIYSNGKIPLKEHIKFFN